jgi:cbb3-type cytochrome oxidase subunit 3
MRDVVAAGVAVALVFAALSLLTTLHVYRKRHRQARDEEAARGRTIIVELPTDPELTLVTEDAGHFYYGDAPIDKNAIMAVRVLINGSPIAACLSPRWSSTEHLPPTSFDDRPEGIARDRWDVAIETVDGAVLIECGAVRERVSQELARKIFDAVKAHLEQPC